MVGTAADLAAPLRMLIPVLAATGRAGREGASEAGLADRFLIERLVWDADRMDSEGAAVRVSVDVGVGDDVDDWPWILNVSGLAVVGGPPESEPNKSASRVCFPIRCSREGLLLSPLALGRLASDGALAGPMRSRSDGVDCDVLKWGLWVRVSVESADAFETSGSSRGRLNESSFGLDVEVPLVFDDMRSMRERGGGWDEKEGPAVALLVVSGVVIVVGRSSRPLIWMPWLGPVVVTPGMDTCAEDDACGVSGFDRRSSSERGAGAGYCD
jgi:hypothetical protein